MFKFNNLFEKAKQANPNITQDEWKNKREEALNSHLPETTEYHAVEDGTVIAGKPSEEQLDPENKKM